MKHTINQFQVQRILEPIRRPLQQSFWTSKAPKLATNTLQQQSLQCSEMKWVSNFTQKTESIRKVNTYKVLDHVFPALSDDKLLTAMKYFDWYFYFDDQFDYVYDNTLCHVQKNEILEMVETGRCPQIDNTEKDSVHFNVSMFFDFWQDLFHVSNFEANYQFSKDIELYFVGVEWMNHCKNNTSTVSTSEYLKYRQHDIGLESFLSLMYYLYPDFTESDAKEKHLIPLINENDIINKIKELCSLHVSLVNDILGFNKDIKEGTGLNYVLLSHQEKQMYHNHHEIPLQQTMDDAVYLCNNLFFEFDKLKQELSTKVIYKNNKKAIDIFVQVYENFIIQHLNWYYLRSTKRWEINQN
eukprot:447266_1